MVLLSGLIGALLGAFATSFVHVWKFNRDELTGRIDDLCKAAAEVAKLATVYWSTAYDDDTSRLVAEAAIWGGQSLIDGMYADVREFLGDEAAAVDEDMSNFVDVLTGGTFSEGGRPVDFARVGQAQQVASNLIVAVRRAHRRTMPLYGFFRVQRDNRARKLDMPPGFGENGS